MNNLTKLTIREASDSLKKGEVSVTELVDAHLKTIEKTNSKLNAFITINAEQALANAKVSEEKIKSGNTGKLEGIPVGVKDLFCTKNIRTTACSKILHNFIPQYESTVTEKLFAAGAISLGKTNMDEFAMGSANITSHFGKCLNPWGENLVPGGSSGGSAAAVTAYNVMGALGSDTGGSIRQPASFCGIVGIKPSYGRCSRYGMVAYASSLDQAGVFTRNVEDAAIMLETIMGYDPKDSTSAKLAVPDLLLETNQDIKGKKIGIPKEYDHKDLSPEVKALWDKSIEYLKDAGAEIVHVSLPFTEYALPTYYVISPAEASSNLARYDGVRYGLRICDKGDSLDDMYGKTRYEGFGLEVKRRIITGTYVLSSLKYDEYYVKAQKVRRLIKNDFDEVFKSVDALLVPTAPTAAFKIGDNMDNPVTMYLNDIFTIPASLAGLPCMSVPVGMSSNNLPLGIQVIAKNFAEGTVLSIGKKIEERANFKLYAGV